MYFCVCATVSLTSLLHHCMYCPCREWLSAVLGVFLDLPWMLRRAAAKSLSAVVAHNPRWSDVIIGGLHTAVERSEFNARGVLEALQCVATPTHLRRESLAVSVLLLAHHPRIGKEK